MRTPLSSGTRGLYRKWWREEKKTRKHEDKGEGPTLCIKGVSCLMNTDNEES